MIATVREATRPTVLLVDDNVEQRDLYALCLEQCANVVTATRGDDALRVALLTNPQAVVLDVHMPGMDGIKVCEQLKNTPATSSIPVLLLTADDDPNLSARGTGAGASAVMTKPCSSEKLTVAVVDALEQATAISHAPAAKPERTLELDIPVLDERQTRLQKMSILGELAGGIAHDFNNVLTGILGYVDSMMEQLGPDKPIWPDLVEIHRLAESAASLTRPLLTFTGQRHLHLHPLDVNQLVSHTVRVLRRVLGERVHVNTRLTEDRTVISADEAQLEHVLMNLALNARDALPDGGTVLFSTSVREIGVDDREPGEIAPIPPGRYVMLTVADTGIGMDRATLARIFEPYFTTKADGKGTGLGLASVRQTAAALGGYLAVQSESDRGSAFTLYFPCRVSAVEAASHPAIAVAPLIGTECVLLVEDDDAVRRYVSKILQRHGYRVLEAASSEEAAALIAEEREAIDLLLADIVLPGQQGPALATRLREIRPTVKVLYMSGYGDQAIQGTGVDAAARERCLGKPFTAMTLVQHVRDSLDEDLRQTA